MIFLFLVDGWTGGRWTLYIPMIYRNINHGVKPLSNLRIMNIAFIINKYITRYFLLLICVFCMGCERKVCSRKVVECEIMAIHDNYFEDSRFQTKFGRYRRIIWLYCILRNTRDYAIFFPINQRMTDSLYCSKIDVTCGNSSVNIVDLITSSQEDKNTLEANDSIRLNLLITSAGLQRAGIPNNIDLKEFASKINVRYNICDDDREYSAFPIEDIQFKKTIASFSYRPLSDTVSLCY